VEIMGSSGRSPGSLYGRLSWLATFGSIHALVISRQGISPGDDVAMGTFVVVRSTGHTAGGEDAVAGRRIGVRWTLAAFVVVG